MDRERQIEAFNKAWSAYDDARPRGDISCNVAFEAGWQAARDAAAQIADEWDHHGDPAIAMYASPRIRDRIKWFLLTSRGSR